MTTETDLAVRPRAEVVDSRELVRAVLAWYATPPIYRDHQTLDALAGSLGVSERVLLGHLERVPGSAHQLLQAVAQSAVHGVPRVLQKLQEAVEAGSIKAAEIYLDFIRKTIMDQELIRASGSRPSEIGQTLEQVGESAARLLKVAQSLGSDEVKARVGLLQSPGGLVARMEVELLSGGKVRPLDLSRGRMVGEAREEDLHSGV